jgi:vacuolar-type H+-ATPase subunit C/Vma6
MSVWVDVVARVRGLSNGLIPARQLALLAHARDLADLSAQLSASGVRVSPVDAGPEPLELAVRRRAGARLRLVARWSGQRAPLLAPLFEDEDRRSIRAMLRGAAAHVPADRRLAGLVPTPALPERALSELASLADVASVAALLAAWSNAYGIALLEEARRQQPDLFRLETVLAQTYAARARRVAGRCGRAMRVYVGRVADLENLYSALLLAEKGAEVAPEALFVEGGTLLPREALVIGAAARTRHEAAAVLLPLVRQSPLAPAVSSEPGGEERVLRALGREQRDIARLDPLGPAPIIEFMLRVRGETIALQRLLWSTAIGAPAERRDASAGAPA